MSGSDDLIKSLAKESLRLPKDLKLEFEQEIESLISAAQGDLILAGISESKVKDTSDSLILRAIVLYVKSEFGLDNPDSEKYRDRYENLKRHLMMSSNYIVSDELPILVTPDDELKI